MTSDIVGVTGQATGSLIHTYIHGIDLALKAHLFFMLCMSLKTQNNIFLLIPFPCSSCESDMLPKPCPACLWSVSLIYILILIHSNYCEKFTH